jgi:hypothetical protein
MTTQLASPVSTTLLDIDRVEFARSFGQRPFRVRHHLADHPLFQIDRLLNLAKALPEHRVEYNAGDLAVNMDPAKTPRTGLSSAETIQRIAECRSWLVLKNIELDAEYRELLYRCLNEVEALGHPDARQIDHREGFIFVSSPNAVTPYHIDPEWNFLLQVRGVKLMHVFPSDDRELLSEESLERFYSGAHRNLVFKDEFQAKAESFELQPGEGVHVPVTAPHWVSNGPEVSISFSITFQTRVSERRGIIYRVNHGLRSRGWKPSPVGQSTLRDGVKYFGYRVMRRLRRAWSGKRIDD